MDIKPLDIKPDMLLVGFVAYLFDMLGKLSHNMGFTDILFLTHQSCIAATLLWKSSEQELPFPLGSSTFSPLLSDLSLHHNVNLGLKSPLRFCLFSSTNFLKCPLIPSEGLQYNLIMTSDCLP